MKYKMIFVVALSLLLSLFGFSVFAEGEKCIYAGDTISVKVEPGKATYLVFIPEVDGEYAFTSLSECDTLGALYDENMKELLYDDDGGDTSNFYLDYKFSAGRKYIFSVWYYGNNINYDMSVQLKLIKASESHIHSYTEEVIKTSDCKSPGESKFYCICGDYYSESYEKLSHSFTTVTLIEPDCTNKGKTTDKCVLCGYINETVIDALGHSFSDELTVDIVPTCSSNGYASRHCIRCDKTTEITVIDKIEHKPIMDYIITKAPTCTSKGEKVKRCADCNKLLETVSVDRTEHTVSSHYVIVKEATCTSKGERVKRCEKCNKILETAAIEKIDHIVADNYETVKLPTCTSVGEKVRRCEVCDKTLESVQVDKISHTEKTDFDITKMPTCTSMGEKVKRCLTCNKILETVSIDKLNHTENENYEIIKESTCTSNGEKVKRCSVCNKTVVTDIIDKKGHTTQKKYTVIKKATCTAKGEKVKYCTICGAVAVRETIDKLGHSFSKSFTLDNKSTFSESGKKSRHCIRCDSTTDMVSIPKIKAVTLSKDILIYNGKTKTLKVTVKNNKGEKLKKNRDYTFSYKKKKSIGQYKLTITFKGEYSGKKTLTYKILPQDVALLDVTQSENTVKLNWKKLDGNVKYRVYRKTKTGKFKLIKETAKSGVTIKGLKSGTEYTFSVKAVKKVKGKIYKSKNSCRVTVSTAPQKVNLTAASYKSRNISLYWDKTSCDGYEIYKHNRLSGEYEPFKNIKRGNITTYERNNMRRGETCYFKIRSYKYNGDNILYSSFSNVVSVRVKY